VSFLTDAGSSTVTLSLGAFRRGGLSLRDLPQLAANSSYAAIIEADGQLLASISSYTPAAGNGSAAIGQLLADASQTQSVGSSLGTFELGGTELPDIVAFNPLPYTVNVTLTFTFDNDEPGRQQSIIILPSQRVRISVLAPTGTRFVSVMANANRQILYEASASSASRADSVSTAVATYAADTWAFADAFLNRELAGISFLEHLSIFNPGTNAAEMTVQFLFPDGRRESRTLTVGAGRTRVLTLHEDPLITEQSSDAWFSIIVTGTDQTVCTFTHWDLLNGGGWTSLGTPMGNVGGF
jgi:hypothetical protein